MGGCAARPDPGLDGCCHLVHGALLPRTPPSSPNPPERWAPKPPKVEGTPPPSREERIVPTRRETGNNLQVKPEPPDLLAVGSTGPYGSAREPLPAQPHGGEAQPHHGPTHGYGGSCKNSRVGTPAASGDPPSLRVKCRVPSPLLRRRGRHPGYLRWWQPLPSRILTIRWEIGALIPVNSWWLSLVCQPQQQHPGTWERQSWGCDSVRHHQYNNASPAGKPSPRFPTDLRPHHV